MMMKSLRLHQPYFQRKYELLRQMIIIILVIVVIRKSNFLLHYGCILLLYLTFLNSETGIAVREVCVVFNRTKDCGTCVLEFTK